MSFRRKLLVVFALTVILCVAAVTLTVSLATRHVFERANEDQTAALVSQFRREFTRRGQEVVQRVEAIASSDAATHVALALNRAVPDYGAYLNEAKSLAENRQLDFLELVDNEGTIISSAQWPAKFGYKEKYLPKSSLPKGAFLREEESPEGVALGLSAIRALKVTGKPLYVIGGTRLDSNFLSSLDLPAGMRAMLYQNLGHQGAVVEYSPQLLVGPSGTVQQAGRIAPLIQQVLQEHQETTAVVNWSSNIADDESVHAIPLQGQDDQVLGVLLIASSVRPYVELQQQIGSAALLAAGAGIVLAILFSGWAAARVTRPVTQLADGARSVAAGNWNTQVPVKSSDELGALAESFNRMTSELLDQKERLVQTERVAAWRDLARRLAHELKNPMFPLQLTVENLIRARQNPEQFEEVFQESSATLLAEIANLNSIVSRFSEFSRMPQPEFRSVQINDVVQNVARLFQAQLRSGDLTSVEINLELAKSLPIIAADPDLLHRALSNLVLNALDAMPGGGRLTLRTSDSGDGVTLEISDTGAGLTPEECERVFTPYYTSKSHGTGLGLAIVQSVVSDHGGRISVRSEVGHGTTFVIALPTNADKAQLTDPAQAKSGAAM
jgi:two-component system, NtrC family, nitrogen regulation sensor histidine kinase NtrY